MSINAKNQLLELLKNLGCSEDSADFQYKYIDSSSFCQATVIVSFPDGRKVQGVGKGARKPDADISAAKDAIEKWHKTYPELIVNWVEINAYAQAGDALIKLGIYLSPTLKTASAKSKELQRLEPDAHLAKVFDRWKKQGNPDLAIWGTNLSEKRKATLIEALLWKLFKSKVIHTSASKHLQELIGMIDTSEV